mgnify:CR=1 FL=1
MVKTSLIGFGGSSASTTGLLAKSDKAKAEQLEREEREKEAERNKAIRESKYGITKEIETTYGMGK